MTRFFTHMGHGLKYAEVRISRSRLKNEALEQSRFGHG